MSRLTRDGTAEPVSRDQILRHARGQGNINFPCSADHEQDWQPYPVDPYSATCDDHTYIHTYIHTYREDQREWHRMTRMTRPDCAVMCNLINIHTYIHGTSIRTKMLAFSSVAPYEAFRERGGIGLRRAARKEKSSGWEDGSTGPRFLGVLRAKNYCKNYT